MDQIILWVRVDLAREEAFALLDDLANRVVDWSFDGPAAGIGRPARARATVPSQRWLDTDMIESALPVRTVDKAAGANGRRMTGTHTLSDCPAPPATCASSSSTYRRRAPSASRGRSSGRS